MVLFLALGQTIVTNITNKVEIKENLFLLDIKLNKDKNTSTINF